MGSVPLTWQEIAAWQEMSGIELSYQEAKIIRECSIEFVNMSEMAKKPDCPPPNQIERDPMAKAKRIKSILRG